MGQPDSLGDALESDTFLFQLPARVKDILPLATIERTGRMISDEQPTGSLGWPWKVVLLP